MKPFKNPLAATMVFLVLFSACTKRQGDETNNNTRGPLFTGVRNVLQANCVNCHGGASPQNGIDFTNDADIVARQARIKVRAVDQAGTGSQMPPPPMAPLSAADQKKITDWIAAGGELTD